MTIRLYLNLGMEPGDGTGTWDESERIDGRLVNGGQVLASLGPCFRFTHDDPMCICVSSDLLTD